MEPQQKLMALCSQSRQYDRFSDLPEHISHHIFSFLGDNYIVRLSFVSRRFRQLCISSPYLYFCTQIGSANSYEFKARSRQFTKFITKLLSLRNGIWIDCLRLRGHCYLYGCFHKLSPLDMGELNAIKCNAQELDIALRIGKGKVLAVLERILNFHSLRVLTLNFYMGHLALLPFEFASLEILSLKSMVVPGFLGIWLSTFCTSLKCLNLENVVGIYNLSITNSSLEDLKICECDLDDKCDLKIACAFLRILKIQCEFSYASNLNIACPSLETFTFECVSEDLHLNIIGPSLKYLSISVDDLYGQFDISVSAERLETLSLNIDSFWKDNQTTFKMNPKILLSIQDATLSLRALNIFYYLIELLSSLRYAKALHLDILIIEVLFQQGHMPILFDTLQHLDVIGDCLSDNNMTALASFLVGLHNLKTLTIKCDQESTYIWDYMMSNNMQLINLLSSKMKNFEMEYGKSQNLLLSHQQLKEVEIKIRRSIET